MKEIKELYLMKFSVKNVCIKQYFKYLLANIIV